MRQETYPSDVSDEEWEFVAPYLTLITGLQSLVWRHLWEETSNDEYRQKLLQYNQEDCNAVRLLLDELCKIQVTADSSANIDYANHPKKEATKEGKEIHDQLETILLFAQTSYDKKKISFRQNQQEEHRKRGAPKGHIGNQRVVQKHRIRSTCHAGKNVLGVKIRFSIRQTYSIKKQLSIWFFQKVVVQKQSKNSWDAKVIALSVDTIMTLTS